MDITGATAMIRDGAAVLWGQGIEQQPTPLPIEPEESDFITVNTPDGANIVAYIGTHKRIIIPQTLFGRNIIEIEPTAANYSDIESVIFNDGITAIY